MNERQKLNKIIHNYVEVNKNEDYTNYKGLITALIEWKNEQLTLTDVSQRSELLLFDVFNKLITPDVIVPFICVHKYKDNVCDKRGVRKCLNCSKLEQAN